MEEQNIVIKLKNGESMLVPKRRLTADSPVFRYILDELNYDEHEIDDFTSEVVYVFLDVLEFRVLDVIERSMFRELNKLAAVFEVGWMKERCHSWLKQQIKSAIGDGEKLFVLEECWYIQQKFEESGLMDFLVSRLAHQDNSTLISHYMVDIISLETAQISLLLELGASNTELFLRIVLENLSGPKELNEKIKYLLRGMNLPLCSERNEELYLEVWDTIAKLRDISNSDLRFVQQMMSDTARSVRSRRMKGKTSLLFGEEDYYLLNSCSTLNRIIESITKGRLTSMFYVVELLLHKVFLRNTPDKEEVAMFIAKLEKLCSAKKLQKVSIEYLDMNFAALEHSSLQLSSRMRSLITEIKENKKLSTRNDSVIIRQDGKVNKIKLFSNSKESKFLFNFKHPGAGVCTEPGSRCGFIVRRRKRGEIWERVLCTKSEDYKNTGLHYHDNISAHEMFWYDIDSGHTADGKTVTMAAKWDWWKYWSLNVEDWEIKEMRVAYCVTDYLVAR